MTPPSQARAAAGAPQLTSYEEGTPGPDSSCFKVRGKAFAPSSSTFRISSFHQILQHSIPILLLQTCNICIAPPPIRTFSSIDFPLQRPRTTPHRQHPASAAYHLASPRACWHQLLSLSPFSTSSFTSHLFRNPSTKTIRSRQARCRTLQHQESVVRALVPPLICRVRLARASRDSSTSVPLLVLELGRSRVLRVCRIFNHCQLSQFALFGN